MVGDVSARKSLPLVLYHRKLHTILADSVLRFYFITEKSDMVTKVSYYSKGTLLDLL